MDQNFILAGKKKKVHEKRSQLGWQDICLGRFFLVLPVFVFGQTTIWFSQKPNVDESISRKDTGVVIL